MQVQLEILHEAATADRRPGPGLLFVHGAFSSARCWQKHFMPWFAAHGYDCWAASFRGHGGSSGQDFLSLASLDHYRLDLEQVVAQFERTPILIGHGMGGLVIQQWLQDHQAPAVALLASLPPVSGVCSMLQMAMQTPRELMQLNQMHCSADEDTRLRQLREVMFTGHTPEAVVREHLDCFQCESHRALVDLSVCHFAPIPAHQRPPLLMLAGENDALLPHHLVHAAAAHCGVTGHTIPGIGHALMLDQGWEGVATRLLDWVESLNL